MVFRAAASICGPSRTSSAWSPPDLLLLTITAHPLFFPKRFLSWGFKTLFASVSSCEWKRLLVSLYSFPPAGLCRRAPDRRRSSWRARFCPSCFSGDPHKSLIPTRPGDGILPTQRISRGRDRILATQRIYARPRLDLSYTKNSARLRSDFTYTKNLGRTIVKNQRCRAKFFRAARANFVKNF